MASGRYVFRCHPSATKIQIRRAIEEAFVDQKITVDRREHHQRARQEASPLARADAGARQSPDWKKAIVTLGAGQKIEGLFEGV